jgi:NAD(P)-dependent dehydrogenase (short-subunit alcohol dehydrogenase family)
MVPRFPGKVVLVTGAGSGIGRATALAFDREGAAVAAADVSVAKAEAVSAATPTVNEASQVIAFITGINGFRRPLYSKNLAGPANWS